MAELEMKFNEALTNFQTNQKMYEGQKKNAKKAFQDAKNSGIASENDTEGSWIPQNCPAFMAALQSFNAAIGQVQAVANARWGGNAEDELRKIGLSREEIQAQTIAPGQKFHTSQGILEF